jgi:hypothetical protein
VAISSAYCRKPGARSRLSLRQLIDAGCHRELVYAKGSHGKKAGCIVKEEVVRPSVQPGSQLSHVRVYPRAVPTVPLEPYAVCHDPQQRAERAPGPRAGWTWTFLSTLKAWSTSNGSRDLPSVVFRKLGGIAFVVEAFPSPMFCCCAPPSKTGHAGSPLLPSLCGRWLILCTFG